MMSPTVFWAVTAAAVCLIYGQTIPICGRNRRITLDVDESRPFSLNCTGFYTRYRYGPVYWDLKQPNGSTLSVATCTVPSLPCYTVSDDYKAEMPESSVITLTVRRNHRTAIAGTIECVAMSAIDANINTASCNFRVIYPAQYVSNCRTEVDNRDWTVSGSCDVDKTYASDDRYDCKWAFPAGIKTKPEQVYTLRNLIENNEVFKRGTCSFGDVPMPTSDGTYNYSLTIDPGNKTFRGQSLEITHPEDPALQDCPEVITEGDDLKCSCLPSASSPPAVVYWSLGEDSNGLLQVQNVNMTLNGTNYTCTQYWGGFQKRISYTLHVEARIDGVSSLTAETVTVGGVVIVVFIMIVIAFVCWIKGCDPRYATPRRGSAQEDSHTYSDIDSLHEENTDSSGRGGGGLENEAFQEEPGSTSARHNHTEPEQPANYIELIESRITATEEGQDQQSAQYVELTDSENMAVKQEQDQHPAHYIELTESKSSDEPDQRRTKHVHNDLQPEPASPRKQCEHTTRKELLALDEASLNVQCENITQKELLALDKVQLETQSISFAEASPETRRKNTACQELQALDETSPQTQNANTIHKEPVALPESQCENLLTSERRGAADDGYEIPVQK
ncbi:hypothetical protein V1264_010526 [Littorina saxatilis]|uniref:Ig-like domain-containing protein n=2 Tax=Littorina saxatilis TaxID=31220 RepID=A0AAN9G0V4_9CAEN